MPKNVWVYEKNVFAAVYAIIFNGWLVDKRKLSYSVTTNYYMKEYFQAVLYVI